MCSYDSCCIIQNIFVLLFEVRIIVLYKIMSLTFYNSAIKIKLDN